MIWWLVLFVAMAAGIVIRCLLNLHEPDDCPDHLERHRRVYRCSLEPGHDGPHRSANDAMTWTRTRTH